MRDIPTKIDGSSTYTAAEFNSNQDERENVVTSAGITLDPPAGPDNDKEMLAKAVAKYAAGGEYYSCSGSSPIYVLSRASLKYPPAYFSGMQILFQACFENTAAPQVNVGSLGAKELVKPDGSAIPNNYIKSGHFIEALYVTDKFYMINYTPSIEPMAIPRMDFKYEESVGTNGATWPYSASGVPWPINTLISNNIDGASVDFASPNYSFTLPNGYKYWVDIYYSVDETNDPDTNRTYIVKVGEAPASYLLHDISNRFGNIHMSSLHGFLDFKAEGSPVSCHVKILANGGPGGTFGKAVGTTFPEIYLYGSIVQTGY